MNFFLGVGGGFLLAVLWMDLMFDVLVFSRAGERRSAASDVLADDVLAGIASYYRRVTTTASPMNHLVGAVMAAMVVILVSKLAASGGTRVVDGISLALCGVPITLALVRIFPSAIRLGTRKDPPSEQSRLAREICRAHLVCFVAMTAFVVLRWNAG
ncbi:MAG TPA: hypothetical protein VN634_12830 [Candidatus Limnocylindrales bacterium]|nr:hypothetical protein [Candidatus Limnocylindrales bacterium]